MSNHPEIQLQADDGTVQGNIYINGSGELVFREAVNGNQLILNNDGTLKAPENLQVPTGQVIEDESNTTRIDFDVGHTSLKDDNGEFRVVAKGGGATSIRTPSSGGGRVDIDDEEGGFTAVRYTPTSTAPGTLELTNADLDVGGHDITSTQSLSFTNIESLGENRSIGVDDSEGVLFRDDSGNHYPLWEASNVAGGSGINISGGSGQNSTPITLSADTSSIESDITVENTTTSGSQGEVPVSNGDGTLSMGDPGSGAEIIVDDDTNSQHLTKIPGATDQYYGNIDPSNHGETLEQGDVWIDTSEAYN